MDQAKFENKDVLWSVGKRRVVANMGCDDILFAALFYQISDQDCLEYS